MVVMHFTKQEKQFLLSLAWKSIKSCLAGKNNLPKINLDSILPKLKQNFACFVTLQMNNSLRGCIGSLNASRPLYQDVIANAIYAAFSDPRFKPITAEDINNIQLEISVLSEPKRLKYKSREDLLKKLKSNYGIILEKNSHTATFLPQVWHQLKEKEDFMSHLCIKAGLQPDEWENKGISVSYYTIVSIS